MLIEVTSGAQHVLGRRKALVEQQGEERRLTTILAADVVGDGPLDAVQIALYRGTR